MLDRELGRLVGHEHHHDPATLAMALSTFEDERPAGVVHVASALGVAAAPYQRGLDPYGFLYVGLKPATISAVTRA